MAASLPDLSPDELAELLTAHMPDIPGFQVSRRLGSGGMSYVYLGVQESLNRQVAIKIISPIALKDEVSKVRFEREARTIAKLQHPVIVDIYEVGRTDLGLLYYVMPYLPRGNLGQRDLREDEPRLLAILRALLWALAYAHEHGVVHRDVKPENVLFDNVDRPRLTDFGIAVYRSDGRRLTNGGFALGSATYMAPEQARGEKVDGRADLYSIGVLTYELLTGDVPFHAEDALSLAVRHAVDPVPALPPEKAHWQEFIDRALAKTPSARYASAHDMMAALDVIELGRQPASPSTSGSRRALAVRSHRTRPTFVLASAVAVLLLAVLVAYLGWNIGKSPKATDAATALPIPPTVAEAVAPLGQVPTPSLAAPTVAGEMETAAEVELPVDDAAAISEPIDVSLPADEQALHRAAQQIYRRRLTQPPGDNALESLLTARQLAPDAPRLAPLGESWLSAMQPFVLKSFSEGSAQPDLRQFEAARQLADALALRPSAAWRAIEMSAIDWLRSRLQAALAAGDLVRLRDAKAQAQTLGIAATQLEPEWSQGIVQARVGERLPGRPALTLLRLPSGDAAGLAVMPERVSRAEYARFVAASGRPAARCKVRTASFSMRARRWDKPGFVQQDDQPVVCVNLEDALAYARWRSEDEGRRYRLATSDEWQAHLANLAGAACTGGQAACAGSVREWTAPCGPGCQRQPVLGRSWRDAAAAGEVALDPAFGYDDVGFRLLREVARGELEQR